MKRILTAVMAAVIMIMVIAVPSAAYADMGMDFVDEYTVRVTNKGGIKLTGYGSDPSVYFPYGARLKVEYWKAGSEKWYVYNSSYSVPAKSITKVTKTPDESTLTKEDLTLVVCGEGVSLFKGPGENFGAEIKDIPVGTELESDYHDGMWARTSYEGSVGWVYFRRTSTKGSVPPVAIREGDPAEFNMTCLKDIPLSEAPGDFKASGTEMKAFTDVTCDLQYRDLLGARWFHISSGKEEGWYNYPGDLSVAFRVYDSTAVTEGNTDLLSDPSDTSSVAATVPSGSVLQILAYSFDSSDKVRYCVDYEGSSLWLPKDSKYSVKGMDEVAESLPEPDIIEPRPANAKGGNALLFGLIGGAAVAVTAGLVLLLLIRKRHGKSEEDES